MSPLVESPCLSVPAMYFLSFIDSVKGVCGTKPWDQWVQTGRARCVSVFYECPESSGACGPEDRVALETLVQDYTNTVQVHDRLWSIYLIVLELWKTKGRTVEEGSRAVYGNYALVAYALSRV